MEDELNKILGFRGEYSFLSNFYNSIVYYEGIKFETVENAYQAAKTDNIEERILISKMTASESKKYSKNIKLNKNWNYIKYYIMFELVFQKFYKNINLYNQLLNTNNKYIEETNYWNDTYWGVCDGVGQNNLGKILMKVRDILNENNNNGFII